MVTSTELSAPVEKVMSGSGGDSDHPVAETVPAAGRNMRAGQVPLTLETIAEDQQAARGRVEVVL